MSTKTVQFNVTDGPSADRIIDSLRYANDKTADVKVEFRGTVEIDRVKQSAKVTGVISSVTYESGAVGMFNLGFSACGYPNNRATCSVKGFYNANTRVGRFTLTTY